MRMPKGRHLLVLVAMCAMMAGSIGMLVNVSGVFFMPIANDWGVGRGDVAMTLTISNMVLAVTGVPAGRLLSSRTFKPMMLLGAVVAIASTAALGVAPSLPVLYALSAVRGFGAGLVGMVAVTTVMGNWFSAGAGLLTSLAMCTSGIAGALLSPVLTNLVAAVGWRASYLVAAVACAILFVPVLLPGVTLTPQEVGLVPFGDEGVDAEGLGPKGAEESEMSDANRTNAAAVPASTPASTQTPAPALAIPGVALALALAFAFGGSFATALPQHFPGLAETAGLAGVGAAMLSVSLVCNSAGKLALGALIDTIGTPRATMIWLAVTIAGALGLVLAPTAPAMLVCAGAIGLTYSFTTVSLVFVTNEVFGHDNYTKVYPLVSLVGSVANAIGTAVIGYLYDFLGSYTVALLLVAALLACGAVSVVLLYRGVER